MLSDARIADITARVQAATEAPWYFNPVYADADRRDYVQPGMLCSVEGSLEIVTTSWLDADGAFIAAARQDIPDLLAERAELLARLAECEGGVRAPTADDAPGAILGYAKVVYRGRRAPSLYRIDGLD